MITVHEVNDSAGLADLAPRWHELLRETPGASFFHTPNWLETYWAHFGAGQRFRVLVVSSQDRILGILPLVVRSQRRRIGSLKVLSYPLDDWGSFYGSIGPDPTTTLSAGLTHVRRSNARLGSHRAGVDRCFGQRRGLHSIGDDRRRLESIRRALAALRTRGIGRVQWLGNVLGERAPATGATTCAAAKRNSRRAAKSRYVRYRPTATACGEHRSRLETVRRLREDRRLELARRISHRHDIDPRRDPSLPARLSPGGRQSRCASI